ncbi:MAG: hypothetical protein K2V71_04950 [Methylotenera sp.]|nr:hypothetical protein [Methylotenera sp.]
MKNPYQEKLKSSAKAFHKNNRGEKFTNGLIVIHQYNETKMTRLSWWDDVSFILNDYLVQVSWVHPRMAFKDQIDEEAHNKVAHLDSGVDNFMSLTEPNYVNLGQSRKKVVSYTPKGPMLSNDWIEAYDAAHIEVIKAADFLIKPFIKTEWVSHSRFVELCAPIEVRNEQDLMVLANLARKLLKRETTLEKEFPNYVYTHRHWVAETENIINE